MIIALNTNVTSTDSAVNLRRGTIPRDRKHSSFRIVIAATPPTPGKTMNRLREIYEYREMIRCLVHRDLRGRYKGSVLGFLWTFLNPLLQLVVYSIVFSTIMRSGIDKFYLFLFVALVPWLFFSASLTGGATSVIAQSNLVKKIYFPREILPISFVTTCFVNMLYCFLVVFAVILFAGRPISFQALLCLPPVMAVEYILALGFAMITSALTVYFKDLEHILSIVAMAWMYLTPILYPITMVPPQYLPLFMLNPMTPIIIAYRDILYYGQIPQLSTLFHALAVGLISLAAGWYIFHRLARRFAEEL